jgi:hypothetical protein
MTNQMMTPPKTIEEVFTPGRFSTRRCSGNVDPENMPKYEQQIINRGFDNTELWQMYETFGHVALLFIKFLHEKGNNCPAHLTEELEAIKYNFEHMTNLFDDENKILGDYRDEEVAGAHNLRMLLEGWKEFAELFARFAVPRLYVWIEIDKPGFPNTFETDTAWNTAIHQFAQALASNSVALKPGSLMFLEQDFVNWWL